MQKKRIFMIGMFLLIGVFFINFTLAQCCEKTKLKSDGSGGAWCVDTDASECDPGYLDASTACSSTSFCSVGTCIDKRDGDCIENTPKQICDSQDGFWSASAAQDLPQCQLGCCAIGDQAAFVTQTKCKSFASLYSIDTHFQPNIQDEISCIATAFPETKGACVFDKDLETTCRMTTRSECQAISDAEFHEGFLCTADDLATNCAPTQETTCVDGKDEVYFLDSCGNVANVYDSRTIQKLNGQIVPKDSNEISGTNYWTYITTPTCSDGVGNAGSESCGDCNYFEGSTCKAYSRSEDPVAPTYGDNVCRSLGCKYDTNGDGEIAKDGSETFLHGETWCATVQGATSLDVTGGQLQRENLDNRETNLPGSRYVRMVCYNGEVTVEPCEDKRAEVCIQSGRDYTDPDTGETKQFKSAVCRVNAWQDCTTQTNQVDCEDATLRDCQWISEVQGDGERLERCAPLIAPGFDFWSDETEDADGICALASTSCTAHYEKSLADELTRKDILKSGYKQIDGEECFSDMNYIENWGDAQNAYCASLGDCQGKLSGDNDRRVIDIIKNYLKLN